jgi:hypothetical protein
MQDKWLKGYTELRNLLMNRFGLEVYVIGGSLLGLVRDGEFLPGDKDFDCAYLSNKTTLKEIKQEYLEVVSFLTELGVVNKSSIFTKSGKTRTMFLALDFEGARIDLMASWRYNNRYYRPTFVSYESPRCLLTPFETIVYRGVALLIPKLSEEHLKHVYGSDWKTPNPDWNVKPLRKKARKWKRKMKMIKELGSLVGV